VAVTYAEWKTRGFRSASQLLEPILRWFERQVREYPELGSSGPFQEAYSEARARLSSLGTISEGIWTDEGKVTKYLGAGAFGTVWRVERTDGTALAYKLYHSSELHVRDKVLRFGRGYRAMNQLDHPHPVKVHKYTHSPVWFYMDFINGPNLRDFVGTLQEPLQIISLLLKISETLQHAHGRNVIHRDIKPENIIVAYDEQNQIWHPYLTDFDLAWFSSATQITKDALGVVFYASPEQLAKPLSRAAHAPTTDVYSFAQLCFFLATGGDPVPFGVADNSRGLRDRISNWKSLDAAGTFLEMYSTCSQQEPGKRLQDFRAIGDMLYKTHSLLSSVDRRDAIDEEEFARQLQYSLVGLLDEGQEPRRAFRSLSGRTTVAIADMSGEPDGCFTVTLQFTQDYLSVQGATHEKARKLLNMRLDKALARCGNVDRWNGTKGTYEVFLVIKSLEANLVGVDKCRQIVARAIDALESS
jgi:serine/threonine protein kinase